MTRKLIKDREKIIIVSVILIAVVLRLFFAMIHFTHYDDIGLVVSILGNGDDITQKLHYKNIIPWTYAPMQCWIIALLVNSKYSYALNLFLGRLPSLIASITNIFLTLSIFKKVYPDKLKNVSERVLAILMISFSWELVIYASQCEPYSIGITGVLLLTHVYIDILKNNDISISKAVLVGALVGYMQYQLFIFVFCFYIAIFINFVHSRKKLLKSIACSIISFAVDIPVIIDFLNTGMLERGLNWNVGNIHQYLFDLLTHKNDAITYILQYFLRNTFVYFRSMFVYRTTTWYSFIISAGIIFAFILGIIYSLKIKDKMNYFFISVLAISLVLIIAGKLCFSPSRHTIIYIPICIYYVIAGVSCLKEHWNMFMKKCIPSVAIAMVLIFLMDIPNAYINRKNRVSEKVVTAWCEQFDPVFVAFYKDTFDLDLMHIPGYYKVVGGIQKEDHTVINVGDKILFYSRARAIEDIDFQYVLDNYLAGNKLKLLDKEEQPSDTEVEYAEGSFFNFGNGYYLYTYLVVEPTEEMIEMGE